MKLSIVTTMYRSAPYIEEFYNRASLAAKSLTVDDYELIFVNDGSPDHSFQLAVKLAHKDDHVMVIDLSRNFGHHKAMMTGLAQAKGEFVFLIDSDLEESPEWLLDFFTHMKKETCDVVFGVQDKRKGRLIEQITGRIFYRTFRFLTGLNQPDNIMTVRLMSRRYLDGLLLHREREINIGGLWLNTGFEQRQLVLKKTKRDISSYSFSKRLDHFINAITSFSSAPLTMTFYFGLCISFTALLYAFYLVINYFIFSNPPTGYTSIIVSIWFFSGLIIFFLGLQGIYISKIFTEVKQRPYTIIREIYSRKRKSE